MMENEQSFSENKIRFKRYLELPVDEFTSFDPIAVTEDSTFDEILKIFERHRIRHLPVVQAKRPIGVISERDVRPFRLLASGQYLSARELMVPNPLCIAIGTPLQDVALVMSHEKKGSALVVNASQELVGIFTSIDALNALIEVIRGDIC